MKKSEGQYWLFVDSKTRVVSRRLSQQGAEEFIRSLRNVNIDHWWAWNPCFRDWIPLKHIVDLREGKVRMLVELAPSDKKFDDKEDVTQVEPSEHTKIPEEYSEVRNFLREEPADEIKDFHGDDLTFSRVPKAPSLGLDSDRRRAARIDKKVEVLIVSRGKSFRTHTLNISVTGVMLEKALPFEMQGGPFEIVFILLEKGSKRQLAFEGKVSGDFKDRRRLVFGDLTPNGKKMLETLFAA
jgi:hypothetical protein